MQQVMRLSPLGIPEGVDPRQWRLAITKRIDDLLEQTGNLIDALDQMDPDPDLEEPADPEPWLGWTNAGQRVHSGMSDDEDREADHSDWEESVDVEPTLGAPERHPSTYGNGRDRSGDQSRWADGIRGDHEREEENEHGGDILDEPHDELDEGDREPSLGWSHHGLVGVSIEGWSPIDTPDDCGGGMYDGSGHQQARQMLLSRRQSTTHDEIAILSSGIAIVGRVNCRPCA